MAPSSFKVEATSLLRRQLGEDPFADGVPVTPPDWFSRQLTARALLHRNWTIFRDRCEGVSIHELARRYGMRDLEVRRVSYEVLHALLRARLQDGAGTMPEPEGRARPEEPSSSALDRDCRVVNHLLLNRPGMRRLRAEHLLRVGIDEHTPLSRVPDGHLLLARDVGPTLLATIRELFPFDPEG